MKKKLILILSCLFISIGFISAQTQASGVVVDESNETVVGATVVVKGTTTGTITDMDGKFEISMPEGKNTLVFTLVGMKTVERQASAGMHIQMQTDATQLKEVEIQVAYGVTKKVNFTGSASVIGNEVVKDVQAISFEKALQGAAPGISIMSPSGQPGSEQQIVLRGIGSVNGNNQPLYVIDGVPLVPENLSVSGVSGSSGSLGISSFLNTADVESITVLKDATSTAMYGSRGSNGVIIITTKSGKSGKMKVSLKTSVGFSNWAVDNRPIVSGDEMRMLFKESYYNKLYDANAARPALLPDGKPNPAIQTPAQMDAVAQLYVDKNAPKPANGYSDWESELFRKNGSVQNYELNFSGGNKDTKYFASISHMNDKGMVENSWVKQYTARLNLAHEADKLKLGINFSMGKVDKNTIEEGAAFANPYFSTRTYLWPTMPIRNDDGTYYHGSLIPAQYGNPAENQNLDKYLVNALNLRASGWAEYRLFDNLKFKQTLSYDYRKIRSTTVWPVNSRNGKDHGGLTIKLLPESEKIYSSSVLSYNKTIDLHNFAALIAWDVESKDESYIVAQGKGFASPQLEELSGAATPTDAYSLMDKDRMLSALGRVNYNYDNKYYVSASARRDGSSRLDINNQWGTFWSASAAWRITGEDFMKSTSSIMDDLKIRASYGTSGNLPVGYYESQRTFASYGNYMGGYILYPSRLGNPKLSWEKTGTWDLGLEGRFFNALSLELDVYSKLTTDLLSKAPSSPTTGFISYVSNIGELSNKGIEISIGYDVIKSSKFFWNTKLNLAHNKNEITKLYSETGDQIPRDANNFVSKKGHSYYTFYTREFAGVNKETGAEQWYTNKELEDGTISHDITENAAEAFRIAYSHAEPTLTGGWMNTLSYKGFELSALVSFSLGGKFLNGDGGWFGDTSGYYDYTYLPSKSQLDRWQKPGDDTQVGRRVHGYAFGNYGSSKWIHSSDHARLKNLSLSYALPENILKKASLSSVRFIVSGTNLLTVKKTPGFDPEVPVGYVVDYQIPPLKDITFGIELSF